MQVRVVLDDDTITMYDSKTNKLLQEASFKDITCYNCYRKDKKEHFVAYMVVTGDARVTIAQCHVIVSKVGTDMFSIMKQSFGSLVRCRTPLEPCG